MMIARSRVVPGSRPFRGRARFSGAIGPSLDIADIAHTWIDADTPFTGTAAAVTGIQSEGSLAADFAKTGTGTVTHSTDGFAIPSAVYFRETGLTGTFDEATLVVEYTANAMTGTIASVDATTESRMILRLLAATPQGLFTNNQGMVFSDVDAGAGDRVTLAVNVNFITKKATIIDYDGVEFTADLDAATTQMTIATFDIGTNADFTLHKLGIFLAPVGETLSRSPYELWRLVGEKPTSGYSTTLDEYHPEIAQSLGTGTAIDVADRPALEHEERYGVRVLDGLYNTVGTALSLHGPGLTPLDETIPASYNFADVGNAPPSFLTAISAREARTGLTTARQIIGVTARPGATVADFDTGTEGLSNMEYCASEAKRLTEAEGRTLSIPTLTLLQGTGDQTDAEGVYLTKASSAIDANLASIATLTGDTPLLMVYQSGGDYATNGTDFHGVKMDQLQLVEDYSGILIMPLYGLELEDAVHPVTEESKRLSYMRSWARAEYDRGNNWNLIPTATLDGTTITVTATCRSDETLTTATDIYAGQGISDLGFEVTGANITGTVVSGNTVTITCDAVPSAVQYAMQSQDASGFTGPYYSAHRGLIRTTLTRTIRGKDLYRFLPSFKATF